MPVLLIELPQSCQGELVPSFMKGSKNWKLAFTSKSFGGLIEVSPTVPFCKSRCFCHHSRKRHCLPLLIPCIRKVTSIKTLVHMWFKSPWVFLSKSTSLRHTVQDKLRAWKYQVRSNTVVC